MNESQISLYIVDRLNFKKKTKQYNYMLCKPKVDILFVSIFPSPHFYKVTCLISSSW